jgi:hypothetical protein
MTPGFTVIPGRSALSTYMEREGNNLRQERLNRLRPNRADLRTAIAESCNDLVRLRELINRLFNTFRTEPEVIDETARRDARDELVCMFGRLHSAGSLKLPRDGTSVARRQSLQESVSLGLSRCGELRSESVKISGSNGSLSFSEDGGELVAVAVEVLGES